MTDQEIFELTERGIKVWPEAASGRASGRRKRSAFRRDHRGPRILGLWSCPVANRRAA